MVWNASLKSTVVRGSFLAIFAKGRGRSRDFDARSGVRCAWNRTIPAIRTMMVDAGGAKSAEPAASVDVMREKESSEGSGYASGGLKRCVPVAFLRPRDRSLLKCCELFGICLRISIFLCGSGIASSSLSFSQSYSENIIYAMSSETYKKTDSDFLDAERNTFRDDGSTASTAVLVGSHLYVANVGDSRTIISKSGKAIPLSEDHKPNRSDERKRIENAGGVVMWAGTWRVGGILAMSRAFGNRLLKQFVVAEPEIQEQEINEEMEFLVLASDGLWDVVPNEVSSSYRMQPLEKTLIREVDAVSLARAEDEPEAAARKLTETAFTRGSADNITCIVVRFHHDRVETSSPAAAA
ncbi:hypothetical protein ACLOJK_010190 [Asimina triloba]